MSLAGQGFELTAAVIGFGLVGYWVGGHLGNAPIGLVVGALLGIFGGLYNLIRSSLRTIEQQEQDQSGSLRDE